MGIKEDRNAVREILNKENFKIVKHIEEDYDYPDIYKAILREYINEDKQGIIDKQEFNDRLEKALPNIEKSVQLIKEAIDIKQKSIRKLERLCYDSIIYSIKRSDENAD